MNEARYDKRIVNLNNPPLGYIEHINSLHCCLCGALDECECVFRPTFHIRHRDKIEIESVCAPYRHWIKDRVDRGVSVSEIHERLVSTFNFKNSYTSVRDFIQKLKALEQDEKEENE